MSGRTLKVGLGLLGILALGSVDAHAERVSGEWIEEWQEDLRWAQREAVDQHPDLFYRLPRAEWDREFDQLIARLPTLEHHEVAVELARIVARVEDGHTRLTLPLAPGLEFMQGHSQTPLPYRDDLIFHAYPIRLSVDSHGVFVRRIAAEHRDALGARVVRWGTMDIDSAVRAVEPTIRRDNEFQVLHHLPMHLVLAEILHARGVTPGRDTLHVAVTLAGGDSQELDLAAVEPGEVVEWVDARAGHGDEPSYLRHPERNFWFEELQDGRTVYLQFNEVYDQEDERLRDFARRLENFLAAHRTQTLILDLRNNRGGNQQLALPLLHSILRSDLNETGRLFAFIGRTTFSAAMTFALLLEKHTKVIFVGEPTGSTPNHFGDSRKNRLPNTGLTLRVSTRYHQYDFTDIRRSLPPHIPVELTATDYAAGRDPVLNTVLTIARHDPGTGSLRGHWRGLTSPGLNSMEMSLDIDGLEPGSLVTVRIPALDLEAEAEIVENTELTFTTTWESQPVVFRGSSRGDWLIGEGDYRSVFFPFVLQRKAVE